jgi:hypothetical protein
VSYGRHGRVSRLVLHLDFGLRMKILVCTNEGKADETTSLALLSVIAFFSSSLSSNGITTPNYRSDHHPITYLPGSRTNLPNL